MSNCWLVRVGGASRLVRVLLGVRLLVRVGWCSVSAGGRGRAGGGRRRTAGGGGSAS